MRLKPSPRQLELYNQICGMFHYKEQLLAVETNRESVYTAAARDVALGAISCAFDSDMDQYEEEIILNTRASMSAEEDLERLIMSYDVPQEHIIEVADMIRKLLNAYSGGD